jgi:hypothetical protein
MFRPFPTLVFSVYSLKQVKPTAKYLVNDPKRHQIGAGQFNLMH